MANFIVGGPSIAVSVGGSLASGLADPCCQHAGVPGPEVSYTAASQPCTKKKHYASVWKHWNSEVGHPFAFTQRLPDVC